MKKSLLLSLALAWSAGSGHAETVFSETFTGAAYDNGGWVVWHAPWGSFPTVNLSGDSAALGIASREGSCGIAILIDVAAHAGKPLTLSGEWGGTATGGQAWVEVMMFQTDDADMTDLSSANFATFDGPAAGDIAIKHDSFGLPDTVWGPQAFAEDATNNGASAGFGGLTQIAARRYLVLALKVGRFGTISGLDNLLLTVPSDPAESVTIEQVGFDGAAFEVSAVGLAPDRFYILRRSLDLRAFADVGDSFTGAGAHTFVDPAPPVGARSVFYQIWRAAGP